MLISQYGLLFPEHRTGSETPLQCRITPSLWTHINAAARKCGSGNPNIPEQHRAGSSLIPLKLKNDSYRNCQTNQSVSQMTNSSQQAFPNVTGIEMLCFPHSPLGLQAFSSVASITCTIKRPIPEHFCERAGNKEVRNKQIGWNCQNWQ